MYKKYTFVLAQLARLALLSLDPPFAFVLEGEKRPQAVIPAKAGIHLV